MKLGDTTLRIVLVLGGMGLATLAVAKEKPYQSVIARNAFGLKPPPQLRADLAPPTPPLKVVLTGVSNLGGRAKAFFEWPEPRQGKQLKRSHGMIKDEELDGVKVLEIDVEKGEVRIRTGTIEMTLRFEKNGASAAGGNVANPTMVYRIEPFTPPLVQTPDQRAYGESVLKVAVATELTRELVERGEHPPFPPTELTPDPPLLPAAMVQQEATTSSAPVPAVRTPIRVR